MMSVDNALQSGDDMRASSAPPVAVATFAVC
jgi:hypothetical protein